MLPRPTLRSGLSLTLVACAFASAASAALLAPPAEKTPSEQTPAGNAPAAQPAPPAQPAPKGSTRSGQTTPTGTGDAPGLPEGPVVSSQAIDISVAKRPGDVIDPAAQAILNRAEKAAMETELFDMVTEYQAKTFDGEAPAQGAVVAPMRVLVQYTRRDAFSMPRMRIEPVDPAAGGTVVIFDGDGSAVLDLDKKLWVPTRVGFPPEAQVGLLSLPRWIIEKRSKGFIKARNGGQVRPGGNEMVAARVLGTEVVDGEECDVVVSAIAMRLFEDGEESQINPGPPRFSRVFETVAFARKDGLPRRIQVVSEIPGRGPNGNEERTALYSKVKVNGALPSVAFGLAMPEGFSDGRSTPPAAPATPPAAPATPPAAPATPPAAPATPPAAPATPPAAPATPPAAPATPPAASPKQ